MAIIDKPTDYFNTVLWTGNGNSGLAITGVDFKPDLTWIKERNQTRGHVLFDVVRGATYQFNPNSNATNVAVAESLKSFDTDGFTVGNATSVNENTKLYVGWNWLAGGSGSSNTSGSINSTVSVNATSGCSVVSYSANNTAGATVGHGLGVVPKMILVKESTGSVNDWTVYHVTQGNTTRGILNETNAWGSNAAWNNTTPTSSVFTIGSGSVVNRSGSTYMAYCFADVQGFSKMGVYTGNGSSTNGTFIYTGFKPAFVMIKKTSAASYWSMMDNKRPGFNPIDETLKANTSEAESDIGDFDFLSNGFKIYANTGNVNSDGGTYIYMSFAENPFVTSTGNGSIPATAR